ncbi:RagB/SusD family nutrient uptake outer membrane protein [Phaeodactylibacter xiamenensis]|uniref:Membrane protein n=1 Tax=Phaeodactylibacter xiamenensis TaxID=1524460 RepID=A0A098S6K9_9BACT|nr:RagB/SusD family nutrient uptake outer membrane protein [Phaeodactylibacter xiamenensis]KGE87790.1 membrane protein [Phaeodactylibacter xiamenensis]
MKKVYLLSLMIALSHYACMDLEEDLVGALTEELSVEGNGLDYDCACGGPLVGAYAGLRYSGTAYHGGYFSLQELTSDEMVVCAKGSDWYDGGIQIALHQHTYTPDHPFLGTTFRQLYEAISEANQALDQAHLEPHEVAQVRGLRAFYYWRLLDLFGRVKIVTEYDPNPPQATREEVFNFVEQELLAILEVPEVSADMDLSSSSLSESSDAYELNRYGALGILARLYLNAEVYTGMPRYESAGTAASYIIDSGHYQLCGQGCAVPNLGRRQGVPFDSEQLEGYAAVFAPNNDGNPEHIFSINYDEYLGPGMNFSQMVLHPASRLSWHLQEQPWNGYATLEEFYNSYEDADLRKKASFLTGPQFDFSGSAVIDYTENDGELQLKYTPAINELQPNAQAESGARPAKFSFKLFGRREMDNDFPIVRLGEVYLIRAEARARLSGNWADAEPDVNVLRARAGVEPYSGTLTADEFLAERGREMFQEAIRRTDLIRFGKYTEAWWEKPASEPYRELFPIPRSAIGGDAGMTQNPGY